MSEKFQIVILMMLNKNKKNKLKILKLKLMIKKQINSVVELEIKFINCFYFLSQIKIINKCLIWNILEIFI